MKNSYITAALLLLTIALAAQPTLSSKQEIEGVTFYQDLKKEKAFYYAPGELRLAEESDGAPKIQLIFTRYTGTKCGGDQGDKQFLNIVQFTVRMERVQAKQLRAAKLALGENATIRPLPIQNVEAYLIVAAGNKYRRLGGIGSSEAEPETGLSSKRNFWTERTFTLRLANEEAQLLQDLLEDDKLAMSINYNFYADVIAHERNVAISGTDSTEVSELQERLEKKIEADSIPVLLDIAGGAFRVPVNFEKYPSKLKKIDINEAGIPSDYPALEVRCYDFADDLRPDLDMKEIQIRALGIGGRDWVDLSPVTFSRFQPDLNVRQVKFRNAVKMGTDFRYRIVEHEKGGEARALGWQTMPFCSGIVDATTVLEVANFRKRLLDIEVPSEQFEEHTIAAMTLVIDYQLRGKARQQFHVVEPKSSSDFKQVNLVHDKDSDLSYQIVWHYHGKEEKLTASSGIAEDDYIYCTLPK